MAQLVAGEWESGGHACHGAMLPTEWVDRARTIGINTMEKPHAGMIPRRFFWLFDLLAIGLSFGLAFLAAPRLRSLLVSSGLVRLPLIAAFSPEVLPNGQLPPFLELTWVFLIMAPAGLLFTEILGGYRFLPAQSRVRVIVGSLLAPVAGLSLVTMILFAVKNPTWSRLFIFSFTALSGLGLGAYRMTLRAYFSRRLADGQYAKSVALVGLTPAVDWMVRHFADYVPASQFRLIGYLRVCPDQASPTALCANASIGGNATTLPLLGEASDLGNILIRRPIHEVVAVQPATDGRWVKKVIEDCDYLGVLLRIMPEALLFGETAKLHGLYPYQPLHLPAVVIAPPHLDSEALFLKRLFDVVVTAALLVLLSPVLFLIAVAIKLTTPDLPVLYPWRVVGQNGVEFTGYKFTTMVQEADQIKSQLMQRNEMNGPVFKIRNDPRVTRLGRFLRKYSLNELPQLWSVIKGDMSLVGPRPAFRHELERYEFWHKRKLCIKPGITCLWQIRGRNRIVNFDDWVKMDLEYIDNWSLWLDCKILLRTAWVVLAGTGW